MSRREWIVYYQFPPSPREWCVLVDGDSPAAAFRDARLLLDRLNPHVCVVITSARLLPLIPRH